MPGIIPAESDNISSNVLVTAALDIGTSFSGFAFLTREDFKINPLRVNCKQWQVGELGILYKTKTILLLNEDKDFVAFGYEAEQRYMDMDADEAKKYYFFKYFKMMLYEEESLRKNMKIVEEEGKKIPALTVFSETIRYLKNTAFEELKRSSFIQEEDIKWVLTLPAIWNESAKQFMKFACEKAGIDENHYEITLEPESAALCCNYLAIERKREDNLVNRQTFENGRKFMVLDLGGGTVDITAFIVKVSENSKNTLKEIYKATGGAWGGRKVDEAFEEFWIKCFGKDTWRQLQKEYRGEISEFFQRFEIQKRGFKGHEKINITLPECMREIDGMEDLVKNNCGEHITIRRGKITYPAEVFETFYEIPVTKLPEIVDNLLSKDELSDIYTVLMVGGFSESPVIQNAIKKTVGNRAQVFVPTEPGSVVLKGAAIYGFAPDIIDERVNRYTYGISTRIPFDETKHSRDSVHYHDNSIEDIFYPFIHAGDSVQPGFESNHTFNAVALNADGSLEIEIYASTEKSPEYTNDPNNEGTTWKIGCIEFPKYDKRNLGKSVNVSMKFGYTTINVSGKLETGEMVDCNLNLLK